ncbi:MAG: FMN-binding negative transcriptional regulator [Betaproteobacteria bacterium]|nr:FMN-binding negative transcriptional regulator [Betaproteobacteria bacterium]
MYMPAQFEETRSEVLQALMREHPFATLVTASAGGIAANHIPLEYDPAPAPFGRLVGHVARANPVWREVDEHEALAIFQGPHAYISPAWYPSKQEHGKVVPTWNYAVVHVRGALRAVEDPQQLRAIVEKLTRRHEAGRPQPWQVADAPPEYIEQMLKSIVGIEMTITKIVGKWKVSQNRSASDRAGVIAGLGAPGDSNARAMSDLIKETLS